MSEPLEVRSHVLYRLFDDAKRLLYVGITCNPAARFSSHGGDKEWWTQVATIALEHLSSRAELESAERAAIRDERPRFNLVHVPQPSDAETHTPHRNVRVSDQRWTPFGFAVGVRNRSAWLNDFIGWVVCDPQLWHDARAIAAKRGDDLGEVVMRALRAYVARHRHLLGEHAGEPPAS